MSAIYLEECFWSILQSRCSGVICHTPHGAAVVVWGQPCSQTWPKWWNVLTWAQHPAKLYCNLDYFWCGSLAEQVFASLWRAAQVCPQQLHTVISSPHAGSSPGGISLFWRDLAGVSRIHCFCNKMETLIFKYFFFSFLSDPERCYHPVLFHSYQFCLIISKIFWAKF